MIFKVKINDRLLSLRLDVKKVVKPVNAYCNISSLFQFSIYTLLIMNLSLRASSLKRQ